MRFNSSYPKSLILESDVDTQLIINAMKYIVAQSQPEEQILIEKAKLILAWIKQEFYVGEKIN